LILRTTLSRSASVSFAALFILALTGGSRSFSQSLDVSQYGHSSWTAEEGAFRGSINAVGQTTDGYLWLGTGFGLLHFDGVRFVSWKVPEGQSLPKLPITRVFGARDGSLWIGGLPGLARLHDAKLTNYQALDQIGIDTILEDHGWTNEPGYEARLAEIVCARVAVATDFALRGTRYP